MRDVSGPQDGRVDQRRRMTALAPPERDEEQGCGGGCCDTSTSGAVGDCGEGTDERGEPGDQKGGTADVEAWRSRVAALEDVTAADRLR